MGKFAQQQRKEIRDAFLSTFFSDRPKFGYAVVEVNGFYIVRQVNGTTGDFVYATYSPESFKNYKQFNKSG